MLRHPAALPGAIVRAPEVPAERFLAQAADVGVKPSQIIATGAGERFDIDGFSVRTVGGQHAVIHA